MNKKRTVQALCDPEFDFKSSVPRSNHYSGISVIEGLGLSMFAQKQDVFDAATWTPLFLALTLYKTAFFAYIMSLLYFVQILLVSE